MIGPYVHSIDPILGTVGGVHLWWYGLSYALGFAEVHLWLSRSRERLGLSLGQVYDFSLFLTMGVLLGGRFVEVVFYERPFYFARPWLIPAYWLGGMATHGLLLGAIAGTWAFCRVRGKPFAAMLDALAIPGALLLGIGRMGNFIDGQIVGRVTDVWWAVKFPDADGFRHPVVLYDGLKNLLIAAFLLRIRSRRPPAGIVAAHFIFWYGFLRVFVDLFRVYPTTLLGLATGQSFNVLMTVAGLGLLVAFTRAGRRARGHPAPAPAAAEDARGLTFKRAALALLLLFSLTLPSDWTQDVPARYGARHPGLVHSRLYPRIETGASE